MEYQSIKSKKDIKNFLDKTNALHDGYIIGVQYTNDALTNVDKNGYYINPKARKLIIRILVTSIWDAVVEIVFDCVLEWQIKDNLRDIVDTSIIFNDQNDVIWSDDIFTNMSDLQDGSYVIAESMKWRIVNDSPKEAER